MTFMRYAALPAAMFALAGCQSEAEQQADAAEDRIEAQADESAAAAGDAEAALGMTERQLLDADLLAADGTELGDIEQVRRDASNNVTGFLIEVEDSNPDRYVVVPLDGLSVDPNNEDLRSTMTMAQIGELPDEPITAQ